MTLISDGIQSAAKAETGVLTGVLLTSDMSDDRAETGVNSSFSARISSASCKGLERAESRADGTAESGVDAGVPAYSPKSEEDKAGMKPLCAVIGVDVGVIGALYEPLDETEETDGVFGGGAIFW